MTHRTKGLAGLAAIALLLATTTAALGYAAQVAGTVTVTAPGPVTCTAPVSVSATVLEAGTGALIEGQPVTFAFRTSQTGDKINTETVTTNALGVATTTVSLSCTPGTREVIAVADGIVGGAVLSLAAAAPSPAATPAPAAGLPNTSTEGMEIPALLVATAAFAGGGFLLRRYAFATR